MDEWEHERKRLEREAERTRREAERALKKLDDALADAYYVTRELELLFVAGYYDSQGNAIGGTHGKEIFERVTAQLKQEWEELQKKEPTARRAVLQTYTKTQEQAQKKQ